MKFFNFIPFLRILLPFLFGIISALIFNKDVEIPLYFIIPFCAITILFAVVKYFYSKYSYRWIFGIATSVTLFLFGFELTQLNNPLYKSNHYIKQSANDTTFFVAKVTEQIIEKNKTYKVIVNIEKVLKNNKYISTFGKAIIYLNKDSISRDIEYGDMIIVKTSFTDIPPPYNPSEFDYKKYIGYKFIYQQAFVKSGMYKIVSKNEGNYFKSVSLKIRNRLLNILRENKVEGKEFAVISAMLLGYNDKLDPELLKEYSNTGVIHILSVSGMHVSLIYSALLFFLFFISNNKRGKIIKAIVVITLIWFYAVITGLSPPVMRAAIMFLFITIGKSLNRYVHTINILSFSIFLLLAINPFLITDIGFQLSYLAVIGISLAYEGINNLNTNKTWLMKNIWTIISVSIAAQLFTFPICIYYFHQFSNIFILANLIIIPLSTFVMYVGIFTLSVSFIPIINVWAAKLLVGLIISLNYSVKFLSNVPYSFTNFISLNLIETLLIYLIVISIIAYFYIKRNLFVFITLGLFIILMISFSYNRYLHLVQKKIIVYNINKTTAIDFIGQKKSILIADSSLINNNQKIDYHIENNWSNLGINNQNIINISKDSIFGLHKSNNFIKYKDFVQFYNIRIVIISKRNYKLKSKYKIKVDYVLITENVKINIEDLVLNYNFNKIIVDASNSMYKTNRLKEEAKKRSIEIYTINRNFAFLFDF